MVVVVILGILAAVATPLLSRDNLARKGRDWANTVAQTLQRARFEAVGDRAIVQVLIYRTHVDTYERATATATPALLSSTPGPVAAVAAPGKTIAIWDANETGTVPNVPMLSDSTATPPTISFSALGSTSDNGFWSIYIRNELLPSGHPDAFFLITVQGLTGFVTANNKVTVP
jgi:Tfp pilus assembly protein FimT